MKKPLKVLQVGMTRILGGLETYLIEQYRHIDPDHLQYDFVNITGEYTICYDDEIRNKGSKIFSVPSRKKNPLAHYWGWYKILAHHKGYDAIVLNTNSLEYVFPLVIGKLMGIPLRIVHSHNSGFENKQGLARKILVSLNKRLLNWSANGYFACSKLAGQWMFQNHPFEVIYNAIDCSPYRFDQSIRKQIRKQLGLVNDEFTILHVGRFTYQKNHSFLIKVFDQIKKLEPNAKLLLVGDIYEQTAELNQLKQDISRLGLVDSVTFLGRRNDVNSIMQAADVLLMPSYFEGLTLVAVEAQAASLPICISDTTTKEVKITHNIDFVSLSESLETWANKVLIQKGCNREDNYNIMQESGFEIHHEARRVEKIYEELFRTIKQ